MKKTVLILGILSSFNANAWEACGTDANGNTANCEYQIIDGTLTIRGTGNNGNIGYWYSSAQYDYVQPWKDKGVKNVVIEDTIKDLGSYAFYVMNIQNPVVIPESVTSISNAAFDGLRAPEVIIPDSVEIIEEKAFHHTVISSAIVIPDSVTTIKSNAFGFFGAANVDIVLSDKTQNIDSDALDSQNIRNIYCIGDIAQCQQNVGGQFAGKIKQATTKKVNGVTYVYDNKGKLVTTSGKRKEKRIYTIEEANAVAKPTGNTVRIKYR